MKMNHFVPDSLISMDNGSAAPYRRSYHRNKTAMGKLAKRILMRILQASNTNPVYGMRHN